MTMMLGFLILFYAAISLPHVNAETLNVGAIIQDFGVGNGAVTSLNLWQAWTQSNTLGFTASVTILPYNADTLCADVQALEGSSHVLVPPYGSSSVIAFLACTSANLPIMVWGGASDSIFSTSCIGKACFGTMTKGSEYMIEGLKAILSQSSKPMTVGLIQNDNAFSGAVCDGAKEFVERTYGLSLSAMATVTRGALTDADLAQVANVSQHLPDIMAICGHSGGDVESVIAKIAEAYAPKAILATNSITAGAASVFESMNKAHLMNGFLMPTQWGMSDVADPYTTWTSEDFASAFGAGVSYHAASAAAAMIAVTAAMASGTEGTRVDNLATLLRDVDIDSFYGGLKFDADGSIMKPMFVQQKQNGASPVFRNMYGNMKTPLSDFQSWGGEELTCNSLKRAFRTNECCGNPGKVLTMDNITQFMR